MYIFTPSAHILKLLHIARLHRRPGVTVYNWKAEDRMESG